MFDVSIGIFHVDPIFLNRNLCYSLKASSLISYFHHILETALNYFCQTPYYLDTTENFYYEVDDYDENVLVKQLVETVHKSYTLFIERFSKRNDYWKNVEQEDLRQDYKQTFDSVKNPIPKPILKLRENAAMHLFSGTDEQEDADDDDDDDDDNDDSAEKHEEISRQDTDDVPDIDQTKNDEQTMIE